MRNESVTKTCDRCYDINSNMDSTKYRAYSCDALNITSHESQRNLQVYTPIMKQETVHLDEEEPIPNDYTWPYKSEQSSDCVNYYDSKLHVLEEVKIEFLKDECPQPVRSISSRLVFENDESINVMRAQDIVQENQQEGLSSVTKDDVYDSKDQFILKMEKLVDHRILNHVVDPSKHCDVLVTTPQEIKCQLCGRRFKNRFDLLQHDNVHIKTVPPIPGDNKNNELYRCQYCNEYFNNYYNMLAHVCDVYSNKIAKSNLSQEGTPDNTVNNGDEMKYKCVLCGRFYKSKRILVLHVQRVHYDYGRQFECWCGKQFRSPIHLRQHKSKYHNINDKNEKFQCDTCKNCYKSKHYLVKHILNVHYDYGKTFDCWCGKQYRTPVLLYEHKYRKHSTNVKKVKSANNEVIKSNTNNVRKLSKSKVI